MIWRIGSMHQFKKVLTEINHQQRIIIYYNWWLIKKYTSGVWNIINIFYNDLAITLLKVVTTLTVGLPQNLRKLVKYRLEWTALRFRGIVKYQVVALHIKTASYSLLYIFDSPCNKTNKKGKWNMATVLPCSRDVPLYLTTPGKFKNVLYNPHDWWAFSFMKSSLHDFSLNVLSNWVWAVQRRDLQGTDVVFEMISNKSCSVSMYTVSTQNSDQQGWNKQNNNYGKDHSFCVDSGNGHNLSACSLSPCAPVEMDHN